MHIHRQRPYDDWLEMDLALIPRMDIVLRLPGESAGADKEVATAKQHGIPVAFGWGELRALLQNERS
jgi:glycine cleavage system pyridoxal-binding protein P